MHDVDVFVVGSSKFSSLGYEVGVLTVMFNEGNVILPYFVHRCVTECLSVYYRTATQVWKAKAENDTEDCTFIFTI